MKEADSRYDDPEPAAYFRRHEADKVSCGMLVLLSETSPFLWRVFISFSMSSSVASTCF